MENLANIKKYKKGQALKGFSGLRGEAVDAARDTGVLQAVSDAIEAELEKLRESLRKHGHSGAQSSQTLEQSIGHDFDMKQQGGKVLIEFFASNQVGEYLDRGTKRAKTDTPPRAMVSSLEDWINTRPTLRSIAQQKQPNKPFNKVRQSFAYAIAKSILRKGIISRYGHKGSKWATEVLGANNEILERNITKAVEQVLGRNAEVYVTKQINNSLKGKA